MAMKSFSNVNELRAITDSFLIDAVHAAFGICSSQNYIRLPIFGVDKTGIWLYAATLGTQGSLVRNESLSAIRDVIGFVEV